MISNFILRFLHVTTIRHIETQVFLAWGTSMCPFMDLLREKSANPILRKSYI